MTTKRFIRVFLIIIGSVAFDQVTKSIAIDTLRGEPPISYAGNLFLLQYSENAGAFLSLGNSLSTGIRFWLLTVAVAVFLFCALGYVVFTRNLPRAQTVALSLILGGGFSNLIDRIARTNGQVVDFMNLGIGSLRTGIFNVADVLIMVGVGLFVLTLWKEERLVEAR